MNLRHTLKLLKYISVRNSRLLSTIVILFSFVQYMPAGIHKILIHCSEVIKMRSYRLDFYQKNIIKNIIEQLFL